MGKKTIKKSVSINTTPEKVWEVLVKDEFNKQWYEKFSPGTRAVGTWEEGSKIIFSDESKSGLVGKIVKNNPPNELFIEYTGWLKDGVEEYDTKEALAMVGFKENYVLEEDNGVTTLNVSIDADDSWFDMMNDAWDQAVIVIKELSERE